MPIVLTKLLLVQIGIFHDKSIWTLRYRETSTKHCWWRLTIRKIFLRWIHVLITFVVRYHLLHRNITIILSTVQVFLQLGYFVGIVDRCVVSCKQSFLLGLFCFQLPFVIWKRVVNAHLLFLLHPDESNLLYTLRYRILNLNCGWLKVSIM